MSENPQRGSENRVRGIIASSIVLWYKENPVELEDAAEVMMLSSGNQLLLGRITKLAEAVRTKQGKEVGDFFMRGVAVSFLYEIEVAEEFHEQIKIVTKEDIERVQKERQERRRQRTIDSEFYVGKDFELKRIQQIKGEGDKLDKPFFGAVSMILNLLKDQKVSDPQWMSFLNGVLITSQLLRK
ncbi:MAG: hypothetical protein HYW86_01995 [Candidatus Roizmanbacteria bacterium]|nr:MAG: hypothetical protein HYW86_01995 [Candidatus Roizmanbacteria bacterium]